MITHDTGEDQCAYCETLFNRTTNIEGQRAPQEGDFTICGYCGNVLVFDAQGRTRKPDAGEVEVAMEDRVILAARAMVWDRIWQQEKRQGGTA